MRTQTLESLRLSMPFRALSIIGGPHKYFKKPPIANRPIIWATGGLGDAILSMEVAEAIQERVGEEVIFYTRYPNVVKMFSGLDARHEDEFIPVGADWWITINTLVLFNFQGNFKGFKNPKMEKMFLNYRGFLSQGDWKFINNRQPFMENFTGIEAQKLGLNRRTLVFRMLGLFRKDLVRRPDYPDRVLKNPFITVHDGYDDANDSVGARSMKNWDIQKWKHLVTAIHQRYPNVEVTQLGGKTSRRIPGVDHDLVGRFSLPQSLVVLSKSSLHIDTESGLVHAAHMMGVKSVVLFGPTNMGFFGYEDNVNIAPNFCSDAGGCWWLKQDWMANCPLGYIAPLCMDSITVEDVFTKVKGELDGHI